MCYVLAIFKFCAGAVKIQKRAGGGALDTGGPTRNEGVEWETKANRKKHCYYVTIHVHSYVWSQKTGAFSRARSTADAISAGRISGSSHEVRE